MGVPKMKRGVPFSERPSSIYIKDIIMGMYDLKHHIEMITRYSADVK